MREEFLREKRYIESFLRNIQMSVLFITTSCGKQHNLRYWLMYRTYWCDLLRDDNSSRVSQSRMKFQVWIHLETSCCGTSGRLRIHHCEKRRDPSRGQISGKGFRRLKSKWIANEISSHPYRSLVSSPFIFYSSFLQLLQFYSCCCAFLILGIKWKNKKEEEIYSDWSNGMSHEWFFPFLLLSVSNTEGNRWERRRRGWEYGTKRRMTSESEGGKVNRNAERIKKRRKRREWEGGKWWWWERE